MYKILLILAGMAVFYFLMILAAIKIKEKKGKQICPICATVSLTWLSLLALRELNIFIINPIFLAILMGASVCGVMYLVEKKIESAGKKVFWKIASTLFGILLVLRIVGREYDIYALLVLTAYLLSLVFSLKKKKEDGQNEKQNEKNGMKVKEKQISGDNKPQDKENWLKKLEDCC